MRKRIKRLCGFEPEHLQVAFGWLSRFSNIDQSLEQQRCILILENLLRGLLRPLGGTGEAIRDSRDSDEQFYSHPREFANWLFNLLATCIPSIEQSDLKERLWKPILCFGLDRHHWSESFLSSWFQRGLGVVGKEDNFFEEWRSMMDFAWDQPHWFTTKARNNESHSRLFLALMGHNRFGPYVLQEERFRPYITELEDQYTKWDVTVVRKGAISDGFQGASCRGR